MCRRSGNATFSLTVESRGALERETDVLSYFGQLGVIQLLNVLPVDQDFATIRLEQTYRQLQRDALADATTAGQAKSFAARYFNGKIA